MYSGRLGTVEDTAGGQVTPVSGSLRDDRPSCRIYCMQH
jgi:hypothetical protein